MSCEDFVIVDGKHPLWSYVFCPKAAVAAPQKTPEVAQMTPATATNIPVNVTVNVTMPNMALEFLLIIAGIALASTIVYFAVRHRSTTHLMPRPSRPAIDLTPRQTALAPRKANPLTVWKGE
jgi:hypothetical protein